MPMRQFRQISIHYISRCLGSGLRSHIKRHLSRQ